VEFQWGKFQFKAVITSISQKFTLFDKEGLPLRATVDVTFQQVEDPQDHSKQNPTSGGGPPMKVHIVQSGERLDLIAHKVYGDATQWRLIAQANNLRQPLRLRDGQQLLIPPGD
jgi:nucleoid-associated protein YgaU